MTIHHSLTLAAGCLTALLPVAASAQSAGALVQRLDSIAGADVLGNRAVGIVVAVVKGRDPRGSSRRTARPTPTAARR